MSDLQFNVPVYHEVELKRIYGWETYYYVIEFVSKATKKETDPLEGMLPYFRKRFDISGSLHGSEIRFILDYMGHETLPHDEEDKKFKEAFVGSLVAFIKTG